MPELKEERLARLRAWLADLELLIAQAERARDEVSIEAARIMYGECQRFIAEAQRENGKGGLTKDTLPP